MQAISLDQLSAIEPLLSEEERLIQASVRRWVRERFLPGVGGRFERGEFIGCFGLSEPDAGSDPGAMKTRAKKAGDDYVLDGTKMWITNAPIAGVAVVWAKVDDGGPESIRGFIVERGMKGFDTPKIM